MQPLLSSHFIWFEKTAVEEHMQVNLVPGGYELLLLKMKP